VNDLPPVRSIGERRPLWPALLCSLAVHVLVLVLWNWPASPRPDEPAVMMVELAPLAPPEPEPEPEAQIATPVIAPRPETPVPPTPEASVPPPPQPSPEPPRPVVEPPRPRPVTAPERKARPVRVADARTAEQPSPDGEAGSPSTQPGPPSEAVQTHSAPASAVTQPASVSTAIPASADPRALRDWLARFRDYPLSARRRGIEGRVLLRLRLDKEGAVIEAAIDKGSGFEILDQAVLDMVARARRTRAPDALAGREFLIPVEFKLDA
jgi:protein TonB